MRKAALVLYGDGDAVPIAQALHRHVLGDAAPFILCDRRRVVIPESVRAPANVPEVSEALAAAAGGSLCVLYRRRPRGFSAILERLQEPSGNVQLYLCMERSRVDVAFSGVAPLELPPLRVRESELPRIIDEYAAEAVAELEAPVGSFTEDDRQWVQRYARSLHDIEKATLRIVAIKRTKSTGQAAQLLGMAPVSLSRWFQRRPLHVLRYRGQRALSSVTS